VWVQEFVIWESASHPAVFSFPTFVKACLPRWSDTDAWLRYEVDAPAAPKAVCRFLQNASTGTCRLTGRMATVFRFVLFRPSSVKSFRDLDPAEESASSRTLKAIIRNSLWSIVSEMPIGQLIRLTSQ